MPLHICQEPMVRELTGPRVTLQLFYQIDIVSNCPLNSRYPQMSAASELIREVSLYSGWWLAEKRTTHQSAQDANHCFLHLNWDISTNPQGSGSTVEEGTERL